MNFISVRFSTVRLFYLVPLTLCALLLLLSLSYAKWSDLESVFLGISMLWFGDQKGLEIYLVENEQEKQLVQLINNSDFSLGLDGWDRWGEVSELNDADGYYLQLGNATSSNLIQENCISQEIRLQSDSAQVLLSYKFESADDLQGFDQVALAVLLNGELFHLQQSEHHGLVEDLIINLPTPLDDEGEELELKICAGNSGDRQQPSWLKLYRVTSLVASLSPETFLRIRNPGFLVEASYLQGGELQSVSHQDELIISLERVIDDSRLQILSGGVSTSLPVLFFAEPPAPPEQLQYCLADNDELVVSFSSLSVNVFWELSIGESVEELEVVEEARGVGPLHLQRPICLQGECLLWASLPEANSPLPTTSPHLLLQLRSYDPTGQCSAPTSASMPVDCSQLLQEKFLRSVIINEIMFNPLGDDRQDWYDGEWVELFNPNYVSLDLGGYRIEDEAGWVINLNTNTVDTNHDTTFQEDVVIGARGYLVAFTRGRAIFNNTGDTAFLFNTHSQLIDQVTHPGSQVENVTYGRYPDNTNNWYYHLPPTPLEANQPSE